VIFARYAGPKAPNWTDGKIYFALPGFEDQSAIDLETIRLEDDLGSWQQVQASGSFVFPKTIYAVNLEPSEFPTAINLYCGQVVIVEEVSDGFLLVRGHGYQKQDHFEILDRTNVAVGNKVLDLVTGIWRRISRLDDDLNLGWWEDYHELLSPDNFIFPVVKGSVLAEPALRCVTGVPGELTEGKIYSPETEKDGLVTLVNDMGKQASYMIERFTKNL